MNALTLTTSIVTRSSLDLLEIVNEARAMFKESVVRHNDFLARCRDELDGEPYETFVESAKGRTPAFEAIRMTADQCKLVAMRESKGVRRRVLARLKELEAQAAQPKPIALPQTYIEALEHLLGAKKSEQAAIEQRDHAIRTKAQIGSKREATSMATASAAKKETAKLKARMGEASESASVMAVEGVLKRKFCWRKLKDYCSALGLSTGKAFNPGIQREVNTYPAAAWMAVHGVDLVELFGVEAHP